MVTPAMWDIAALWNEQSAVRRRNNQANAERQSEQDSHTGGDRFTADRRAMIARLAGVGSEQDPSAERTRRTLADGLLERHGIDIAEIEQDRNPAAFEQAVCNAYSACAAADRARTAQRYATDAGIADRLRADILAAADLHTASLP